MREQLKLLVSHAPYGRQAVKLLEAVKRAAGPLTLTLSVIGVRGDQRVR